MTTKISCSTQINAPKEKVSDIITNIDKAAEHISGIKSVKFFEKLEARVIGLKWRDVRVIFGKEAETA